MTGTRKKSSSNQSLSNVCAKVISFGWCCVDAVRGRVLSAHGCLMLAGFVVAGSGSVSGAEVGAGAQRPGGKGMAQGEPVLGFVPTKEPCQVAGGERVARADRLNDVNQVGRHPPDTFVLVLFPDEFHCFGCRVFDDEMPWTRQEGRDVVCPGAAPKGCCFVEADQDDGGLAGQIEQAVRLRRRPTGQGGS